MVIHFLENNGNNKHGTAKEFDIQPKQVVTGVRIKKNY